MAQRAPRRVVIDGEPMVAVTPHDFEELAAMRRQLGGQGVRMRSLRQALLEIADFLEALDTALRGQDGTYAPGRPGADSLLSALPERIHHARRTAGAAKRRPPR